MEWYAKQCIIEKEKKQIDNIDNLINLKKYNLARREAYNLLNQFPNFYLLRQRLIVINHLLGDDKQNIEYLNNILSLKDSNKVKACLFECYYYTHNYEKAFDLLDYFMDAAKESKLKYYRAYEVLLMKKLDMNITLFDFEKDNYLMNQIIHYNIDNFYKYMDKLFDNYHTENIKVNEKIDIKELTKNIVTKIPTAKRSKILHFMDIYHFYCKDFIIDENNNSVDYIRVKTIPGTSNILFIDPEQQSNADNLNSLLIQEENSYSSCKKVKRKSQIEKFYSRYYR